MSKKILTISIAAYNVSETIDECLSHFLNCRHLDDLEILVVNDGSTDDTVEKVKKYTSKYPDSIILVNKENGGWGSTLNKGIEVATGKYFRQLDGDDYYDEKNLDALVEYLKNCDTDIVATPFCHFADDTGAITKYFENDQNYETGEVINIIETDLYPPAMHSINVKTSILKKNKINIMEHCFYTDVEFVIKSLNNSKTISFFGLPVYYYRLGRDGQSMSISGVRKHYKDHQKMLLGMYDYVYNHSSSEEMKKILLRRLIEATMYQYKFYMALKTNSQHRKELAEFDAKLKEVAPECYDLNYGAPVRIFRKNNFRFYKPISAIKNYQDKKHEAFLYEK